MESYGEILRKKREEKGLGIDNISREISIEPKFLKGLEEEDNSVFPGEVYLTGFLRNYANYLDLDFEYLIKLYHNKQLQESPVPEGLLGKPKPRFILPLIFSILGVLILVGVGLTLFFVNRKKSEPEEEILVSSKKKSNQYELSNKKFNGRLYKGDQLAVPTSTDGKIILTVKDTLSSFGLDTPVGVLYVDLSEEAELDIDGDNKSDMIVYVSDISSTDENRGAEVSILLRNGGYVNIGESVDVDEIPFASEISSKHPQKVILEDNRAYPFTVNASFRASCLFRDKVDREDSVETYFAKGDVFTATPHNGIRLWISNSNVVKLTIIADSKSFDLEMGVAGEVLVEDIKWIKDTDGKYKLVVIELD